MGIKISELESTTTANANDVFIINQNGSTKKITKEILLGDISQYLTNVYTKTQTDTLLNEKANQDDLDETNTFVTNLRNRMTTAEGNIMDLQTDSGATLELSMNTTTYVLTANLKNKAGVVVSTSTIDLPLESLVKDIQYDSTTKEIVFILQDGTERRIPLSDLISGLVNQEDFEASQEEQDTRITDLEKEVEILSETIDSELEDGTATGESITVNDSARAKAKLDVGGNTSQNQYEGYNLFESDSYPVSRTINGVTVTNNGDGSFTLNGTCTTHNTNIQLGETSKIQNILAKISVRHTAYYVSGTCTKGKGSSANYCVLRFNYNIQNSMIHLEQLKNAGVISKTNSQNTTTLGWSWTITLDTGDTFDNFTIKYMLVKGTEELPYEPFVGEQASPNTEYPQIAHTLKGSNTIKINNKNLCELELGGIRTGDGQNTSIGIYARTKNFIPINEIKYVTAKYQNDDNPQVVIFEYDENKNFINYSFANDIVKTTQVGANTRYVRARFQGGSQLESYKKAQVEYGATASEYEEHKEQVKTLTLPNGMEMCGIEDSRDEFVKDLSNNKWYKNKKIDKRIINQFSERVNTNIPGKYRFNNKTINNGLVCDTESNLAYCDKLKLLSRGTTYTANNTGFTIVENNQVAVYIEEISEMTLEEANVWLAENLLTFYYPLATPVLEEITDTTLIAELDDLYETLRTYYGQTNITVESEDLPPMMTLNYKKSNRLLRSEIESIKARLDLLEN